MDEAINLKKNKQSNRNFILNIKFLNNSFVIKKFDEYERFNNEIKYNKIFFNLGFKVSRIHFYDYEKKVVIMNKIKGRAKNVFNKKELLGCIDILVKIANIFWLDKNNFFIKKYVDAVESNIKEFAKNNLLKINKDNFNKLLNELNNCCYISIFKDCKPTNWIFNNRKIYILDFDYVKKSFFLSDLAQLLSYSMIRSKINIKFYLKYFLKRLKTISFDPDIFYRPFLLAIINSNICSVKYNQNMSNKLAHDFKNQNLDLLREVNLI